MPLRTRTTGRIRAVSLAAAVLVLLGSALGHRASRASADVLLPGSDFTITTTISSSPLSADRDALLYPGATRYLWYTVHNPLPQAITVTSLGVTGVRGTPDCPATNLDVGALGLTGAFVVPTGQSATVLAPRPISLLNLPINQDSCKDVTFTFSLTGSGWYTSQNPPDGLVGTAVELDVGPSPSAVGQPVTLTARVVRTSGKASGAGTELAAELPTGSVSFFQRTGAGHQTLLGTGTLDAQGAASLSMASLPGGSRQFLAVYTGSGIFAESTSALVEHATVAPPSACRGPFTTAIIGDPDSPVITGTSGSDFIYAVGGDYRITGGRGNDCIVVGDGTNVVTSGSGYDVVLAGHGRNSITVSGRRNTVVVGDGTGNRIRVTRDRAGRLVRAASLNRISLGDGAANTIQVGSGSANRVTVGHGRSNRITLGTGRANRVTVGNGRGNAVRLTGDGNWATIGNGAANRVALTRGSRNQITMGNGSTNSVTVTRGNSNRTTIGHGTANRVTIVRGNSNRTTIGHGTANQVTVTRGDGNRIRIGNGKANRIVVKRGTSNRISIGNGNGNRVVTGPGRANRIVLGNGAANRVRSRGTRTYVILGSGTRNVVVARPRSASTCSLPTPPLRWRGAPARYYRDTIVGCRVVRR